MKKVLEQQTADGKNLTVLKEELKFHLIDPIR